MTNAHLYIHIPFCDAKCPYCSFNSTVDNKGLKACYLEALLHDIQNEIAANAVKSFGTVYIGGGTPSVMEASFYEKLFEALNPYLQNVQEVTFEANPNSFTPHLARTLKNLGVDRVSFGVQSFDENKLKILGRIHSKQQAIIAIELAQKTGFEKLSLDLIYGVKGDTDKRIEKDLVKALTLGVSHISTYALTIEENTPFFKNPAFAIKSERTAYLIKDTLEENGFLHYEVSNYGQHTAIHNTSYWRQSPYIGVGAGAVGFKEKTRYTKRTNIADYLRAPLYKEMEPLNDEELRFERLFMGFRSFIGVDSTDIYAKEKLEILLREDKLYEKDGKVFNKNFFLADELVLFLEGC